MPFVCVFNEVDRDKLANSGFIIVLDDKKNGVFLFARDQSLEFILADMDYCQTDKLTFGFANHK